MEIDFNQDLIKLNPNFQFCTTYNPGYEGRRDIPKSLQGIFRNVALINVD